LVTWRQKNIVIEWRSPEGKPDRMPTLAAELVRLKVDVIVTAGGGATRSAKEATSTIPIVMAQDEDPVGNGFVASLARPGGNITGLSNQLSDVGRKQLEILHVTVFGATLRAVARSLLIAANAVSIIRNVNF